MIEEKKDDAEERDISEAGGMGEPGENTPLGDEESAQKSTESTESSEGEEKEEEEKDKPDAKTEKAKKGKTKKKNI